MSTIKTAVLPVAGLGTRFLPVTKGGPKEMIPILNRPLIQYVVDEAISVGISQLVLVTNHNKRALEVYFDCNYELEARLEQQNKQQYLAAIKNIIPPHVNVVYVHQPEPLGLGHAVLCAKDIVGDSPFIVLLADDVMSLGARSGLQQMVDIYAKTHSSVLAVEKVPAAETHRYGIVRVGADNQVKAIVEKPNPEKAPSNLAVIGRYILSPKIFQYLEGTHSGVGGEIQLTDAIAKLLEDNDESVRAFEIEGRRYDCGQKIGFLEANIDFALQEPGLRAELLEYLRKVVANEKQPSHV